MSVTRSPGTVGLPQVHSDNVSRASGYDFFNTPPTHTLLSTASPQLQGVALLGTEQPSSLWRARHCGECFVSTSSDCQDPPHSKRHAQRNSLGVLCHEGEGIGTGLQLSDSVLGDMRLTPVYLRP